MRTFFRHVVSKCYLGDWFVLHQISKNVNPYFMREFMKELSVDMKKKKKSSRAKSLATQTAAEEAV